jgi:hypothetical protein
LEGAGGCADPGAVDAAGVSVSVSPGGAASLLHPASVMSAKVMLKPNAKEISLVFIAVPLSCLRPCPITNSTP